MATLKGWERARLAYKTTGVNYVPIACITSRSESNETELTEKTNVCTLGKTIKTPKRVTRTVDIEGEVTTTNSLDALRGLQDAKVKNRFRVYNGTGETGAEYFDAVITSLSCDYSADSDATFSMSLSIIGTPNGTP